MIRTSAVLLLVLLAGACEPEDRRPGAWLSGEVTENATNDWSFVDDVPEIFVETRPWYGVPFSVTTVIGTADGRLYVPSIYAEEAAFPGTKYWNRVIAENPDVRLKIGGKLYEMRAELVQEPAEFRRGVGALAGKYDSWRRWMDNPDEAPHFVIIRMVPRA